MAATEFHEPHRTEPNPVAASPLGPRWVALLEANGTHAGAVDVQQSLPAALWNIRVQFWLRLAHTILRTKTSKERKARAASYSVALRKAPASWTFIKDLHCASSFREPLVKELKKLSLSTLPVVLREVIDLKQV